MMQSEPLRRAMLAVASVAQDIAPAFANVGAYEGAARDYLFGDSDSALAHVAKWRRDTRETSRRVAYGHARAALALCLAPGANLPNDRKAALIALAQAITSLCDSESSAACAYAIDARRALTMESPIAA